MEHNPYNRLFKDLTKGKEIAETYILSKELFEQSLERFEGAMGLYSWHLYPNDTDPDGLEKYHSLYGNKSYKATIESKFGEVYKGDDIDYVGREDILKKIRDKKFTGTQEEIWAFKLSSMFLSPPIYVGRSENLATRLKNHFEELGHKIAVNINSLESPEETKDENDEETSSSFAYRVCSFVRQDELEYGAENKFEIGNFIVKVIVFNKNSGLDYDKIKDLEYILNRSYKPVIGKL